MLTKGEGSGSGGGGEGVGLLNDCYIHLIKFKKRKQKIKSNEIFLFQQI